MKKFLLATSVLAATTGFAAAEVTLSGDARMGIIDGFGSGDDIAFTSRARVKFSMVGTTDGGIEFGASFRASDAGAAASGTAGSVYVSSNGFKISMGDVDGAALSAVGHVSGVGLTGLDDMNESTFIGNGGSDYDGDGVQDSDDPAVLVEYAAGAITGYFSISNPQFNESVGGTPLSAVDAYAIGAKYSTDVFSVALGYEKIDGFVTGSPTSYDIDHIIIGADYTIGAATLKARYGTADGNVGGIDVEGDQWAASVDYKVGATTLTAYYTDDEEFPFGFKAYGVGASYDLGGGASIVGGYAKDQTFDVSAFDLGVSMSF